MKSRYCKTIKVVDFGIAGILNLDPTSAGSLKYIAPEVLVKKATANPSLDIWALGVILYIMILGYKLI